MNYNLCTNCHFLETEDVICHLCSAMQVVRGTTVWFSSEEDDQSVTSTASQRLSQRVQSEILLETVGGAP